MEFHDSCHGSLETMSEISEGQSQVLFNLATGDVTRTGFKTYGATATRSLSKLQFSHRNVRKVACHPASLSLVDNRKSGLAEKA